MSHVNITKTSAESLHGRDNNMFMIAPIPKDKIQIVDETPRDLR